MTGKLSFNILFLFLFIIIPATIFSQVDLGVVSAYQEPQSYDELFNGQTLRVDYFLAGNAKEEVVYFREMKQEPYWGGSKRNFKDIYDYGTYRYCVFDSATKELIFSRGFCSLFQEWQGTVEAKKISRAFPMTAIMPFPKKTIRFVIEKRRFDNGEFMTLFERTINPTDYFISREKIHEVKVTELLNNGAPENHVDIVFLAEGYTLKEMPKFLKDSKRMMDTLFHTMPYSEYKDKFNFYAVHSPSDSSGVDIPGKNVFINTAFNSQFYTFDMDRYLTTFDSKSIYDLAANVPYDGIIILVNSKQYGGGGFYNLYSETTVDNAVSPIIMVHEFGHSFAGLADEYIGNVSYSGFYNLKLEPWEPNLTTNMQFERKWKDMLDPDTPVPTPRIESFRNAIGMFEGGGYEKTGMFSPYMDCRMNTNEAPGFCPVCQLAIRKMILFYGE